MIISISSGDIIIVQDRKKGTSSHYLITIEHEHGKDAAIGRNIVNGQSVCFSFLRNSVEEVYEKRELNYDTKFDDESPDYIKGTEDGI